MQAQFESAGPFNNAAGGSALIAAQNATLHFDGGPDQPSDRWPSAMAINNVFGTVANSPSGNITIAGGAGVTFYGDVDRTERLS